MPISIVSGGITPNAVLVDGDGRLTTSAVVIERSGHAAEDGLTYMVTTGFVTTVSAASSGMIYIKNTSSVANLFIDRILMSSTQQTNWTYIKNPTTGTLISGGSTITPINCNFGSGSTFTGEAKSGVSGSTVTNGTAMLHVVTSAGLTAREVKGNIILTTNGSFAITATPASSSTIAITVVCYYSDLS